MSALHDFSKSDEMRQIAVNWRDRQRSRDDPLDAVMTSRCSLCDWKWTAPAREVMALHKAHRAYRHSGEAAAVSTAGNKGSMGLSAMYSEKRREYERTQAKKRKEAETLPIRNKLIALLREGDKTSQERAQAAGVTPVEKVSTMLVWAVRQGEVPGLRSIGKHPKTWTMRPTNDDGESAIFRTRTRDA